MDRCRGERSSGNAECGVTAIGTRGSWGRAPGHSVRWSRRVASEQFMLEVHGTIASCDIVLASGHAVLSTLRGHRKIERVHTAYKTTGPGVNRNNEWVICLDCPS